MKYRVYSLSDPRTGQIRYIGITVGTIECRFSVHMAECRNLANKSYHKVNWIRSLIRLGLAPALEFVEETDDRDREKYWIAHFRDLGCPLTNLTEGGEGLDGMEFSTEHRQRIGDARRGKPQGGLAAKGQPKSAEHRANISKAMKEKWKSPEFRAGSGAIILAAYLSNRCRGGGWNRGMRKAAP